MSDITPEMAAGWADACRRQLHSDEEIPQRELDQIKVVVALDDARVAAEAKAMPDELAVELRVFLRQPFRDADVWQTANGLLARFDAWRNGGDA